MLVKIKNSALLKYLCFYLILSFVAISCDSKGTLLTSAKIDKEVEMQMNNFGSEVSKEDCEKVKDMLSALKSYVLLKHADGNYVSNGELMDYSLSYGQQKGYITDLSDEAKNALVKIAQDERYISGNNSHKQLLSVYEDMGRFSHECSEILRTFESSMESAKTEADAYKVIQNTEDVVLASSLNEHEKSSLDKAFYSARQVLCSNPASDPTFSQAAADRGWVVECITTAVWTFHVISVVLFVAAFFLSLITFGLAAWIAVAIAVTVYTLSWVVYCTLVWHDENVPLCPDGQKPTCRGSFIFDEVGRRCINKNIPSDAFVFGDCISTLRPTNGICPSGSSPHGANCDWECFFPTVIGLGKGTDGFWQYNFECK
jgi:hypothetical protein